MSILANRRVLLVEDEFLILAMLCDMIADAAATVVGPATTLDEALQLAKVAEMDAAILDMNLSGQWSDPVAETLGRRGIPFVFTTGYGVTERSQRFGARTVAKPYTWEALERELGQAISDAARQKPLDEEAADR